MHIVQILPELNQGGVERGVVELNRELVKRGHQSTVISAGGSLVPTLGKEGGNHITLDVCSKNPLTFPFRVFALRRTLRMLMSESSEVSGQRSEDLQVSNLKSQISSGSPLILHARSRVPAWLCRFANKKLKLPFVTTVHGFNSVSKYSEIMTKGDRVIYGSTSIKEYILKNYPVDKSTLRYVPRGIDMDYFDPAKVDDTFIQNFKKEYQLKGRKIITIVGRITEWKGHDDFIRALVEVQKKDPKVIGVVAGGVWHGKEDYLNELKQLAQDTGAEIRFTGSQSQIREIYALSDLVVSAASTKPESFGRTAAEALAMNTPVIASAHGGSLDILLDGENGFLFPPNDHHALAQKLFQALEFNFSNLRNHIEAHFSLAHMTETELAIYEELL